MDLGLLILDLELSEKNLSEGYFYYLDEEDSIFENYGEIIPNEKKDRSFDVTEIEVYQINY